MRIFPMFVLAMWVTFGVWIAQDDWSGLNWLMLCTAALCCAIVFADFTSVFNYGYSLTMVLLPIEILIFRDISTASVLVAGLTLLFGLRLLVFTQRRRTAASFAGGRAAAKAVNEKVPTPVRVMIFLFVTTLMTFTGMPAYLVAVDGDVTAWVVVGAALMALGLVVEALADEQKQRAKARDNATFVRTGLWSRTRHPNYTGEIVFQVGLAVAALGAFEGWWQLLAAVLAPGYIVVLMYFSAKSADARMAGRYGTDPAFQEYQGRTGALLPGGSRARA
jgi:steroid 5-alpha reductase family enzyme